MFYLQSIAVIPSLGVEYPKVSQDVSEGSQNDPLEDTELYLFFKTFI